MSKVIWQKGASPPHTGLCGVPILAVQCSSKCKSSIASKRVSETSEQQQQKHGLPCDNTSPSLDQFMRFRTVTRVATLRATYVGKLRWPRRCRCSRTG